MFGLCWRRTNPSPTVAILADEFAQIHGSEPREYESFKARIDERYRATRFDGGRTEYDDILDAANVALCKDFHAQSRTALCLSGGGIRSAAFGLGVLQWLAKHGYLDKFQYLSTVSGGGYIGSWLSTWIAKESGDWLKVRDCLNWQEGRQTEPREIRHLRENSRYLTQKSGLASGDTWAAFAIWLRNLVLNWLLILPLIGAVTLVPKILMAALAAGGSVSQATPFMVLALVLYATAVMVMAFNRPRWTRRNLNRGQYLRVYHLPLLASAALWIIGVALLPPSSGGWRFLAFIYAGLLAALYAKAWASAILYWRWGPGPPLVYVVPLQREQDLHGVLKYEVRLSKPSGRVVEVCAFTEDRQAVETIHFDEQTVPLKFEPGETRQSVDVRLKVPPGKPDAVPSIEGRPITTGDVRLLLRQAKGATIARTPWVMEAWWDGVAAFVRGAAVGLLLATLHFWLAWLVSGRLSVSAILAVVMFGLPGALGAHLAGTIVFLGLNNKTPKSENDREWHGRIDGFALAISALWMLWIIVALVIPMEAVEHLNLDSYKKAVSVFGAVSAAAGTLAAWIGQGAGTPATSETRVGGWRSRLVLPVAGILFVVSLVAGISLALDPIVGHQPFLSILPRKMVEGNTGALAVSLAGLCAVLAFVPMVLGRVVNVNRFSLHSIYRNRLIRAFMGASTDCYRTDSVNRLTGFRDADNIEMQRLWNRRATGAPPETDKWRPFHVINMALNVVSGADLALKDRKALPFVATPLWCGAAHLDGNRGAFRRSSEFGGEEKTITVGTAMAISGAAVSPNMGYHSSPLVSFLLTFFNVRLGWWYGNPTNEETYRLEGPRWATTSLLYEAFGLTNETRPYVYLSDGGHFDNLGLYEMVRRRCHLILVVDAGQDANCGFEDLSNSIARISTDFGIPITFDLKPIRKRNADRLKPDEGGDGFALGTIHYGEVDGENVEDGMILYVKPSFRGDEPVSILGYAAKSKAFPHESTLDQWFTESQFESYRALGVETMTRVWSSTIPKPWES